MKNSEFPPLDDYDWPLVHYSERVSWCVLMVVAHGTSAIQAIEFPSNKSTY